MQTSNGRARRVPGNPPSPTIGVTLPSVRSTVPASVLSPLGDLLSELREERLRRHAADPRATPEKETAGPAKDVVLRPETGVVSAPPRSGLRARPWLLCVSLLLNVVLLLGATLLPLIVDETLPLPGGLARAVFVEPVLAPPPPPPPPPPPRVSGASPPQPPKAPPAESAFTAPTTVPERVVEETSDLGTPAGEPGGVEGGVPGGVVGAVVGGLPPQEPEVPIVKVGGEIREPRKVRHVDPIYPEIASRARVQGTVVLECIVSPQGQVVKVSVQRSIPLLDDAAIEAVEQWVYTPTLKDGVPVKVIFTVSVRFALAR